MQRIVGWRGPGGYEVSTDPERLDLGFIHAYLKNAYWSPGISRQVVERSIANSLPFGLYGPSGEQAGFARAVTDYATYGYLGDVFVVDEHRGRGLGKFLVTAPSSTRSCKGYAAGRSRPGMRTGSIRGSDLGLRPNPPIICSSNDRPRSRARLSRPGTELHPRRDVLEAIDVDATRDGPFSAVAPGQARAEVEVRGVADGHRGPHRRP